MKKLILFIVIVALTLNSCTKGDIYKSIDGCPVDASISTSYLNDAQEIVYRRILSGLTVLDSKKARFNQLELNRVLSAIQSVYALHSAQTDSIFNYYNIHTHKVYVLNSIELNVNVNSPEIKNMISGKPTGNTSFDGLLSEYGFIYYNNGFPPTAASPYLDITSDTWYNMQALLPLFKSYPFILGAQGEGTIGDGNDITYQINGNVRTLDFSYGYGDCPAGCIGRATWEFNVDENCKAGFVKFTMKP